jgi:hypothetical protein
VSTPTHFAISVDILAPPARVAEVMLDVERWHEWTDSIRRVSILGGGPLAIGKRAFVRQPGVPPAFWKATALEPGRGFTWTSSVPGLLVIGHHYADPIPTGSRATLSLDYTGLFGPLMARMTVGINDKYLAMEAAGLKARSEAKR